LFVRAAQSALARREYVTDARLNCDNRRGIEVHQTCGRPGARMDWPEIWGVLLRALTARSLSAQFRLHTKSGRASDASVRTTSREGSRRPLR